MIAYFHGYIRPFQGGETRVWTVGFAWKALPSPEYHFGLRVGERCSACGFADKDILDMLLVERIIVMTIRSRSRS